MFGFLQSRAAAFAAPASEWAERADELMVLMESAARKVSCMLRALPEDRPLRLSDVQGHAVLTLLIQREAMLRADTSLGSRVSLAYLLTHSAVARELEKGSLREELESSLRADLEQFKYDFEEVLGGKGKTPWEQLDRELMQAMIRLGAEVTALPLLTAALAR